MSRFRFLNSALAIGLFSSVACSQVATTAPSSRMLASGPATSDTPGVSRKPVRQLPPDVQQDPGARVMLMQQLRRPIVHRVKGLSRARYQQVRPELGRQLAQMGFDDQDVAYFLTDLDRTRASR
jgi:hypothetical protein